MNTKTCSKCNTERDTTEYRKAKQARDGLRSICKPCDKLFEKGHRATTVEKRSKAATEYRAKNRDKLNKYHQDWYEKNLKDKGVHSDRPEYYQHYRSMVNQTQKERLKEDLAFKIKRNVGRMMKNFFNKTRRTYEIVGCTQEHFHEWILWQADLDDIDMQQYGEDYHIDHVVPCAAFRLADEEEQRWCFNWSNMRPMLAVENIRKGDAIDKRAIMRQEIRALCYIMRNRASLRKGEISQEYVIRTD
jgi:hypothetical protein